MKKISEYEDTIGQVGRVLFDTGEKQFELITIDRFAEYAHMSAESVRRQLDTGLLIGIKIRNLWFVKCAPPLDVENSLDDIPF